MNNIMDYLDWRGDIGFDQDGLNEVDNLIFSMVAYLNFDMIRGAQTIEEASKAYKDSKKRGTSKESRDFIKKIERLLDKLAKTQRYRGVTISDYMYKYDHDNESQFCAMTFRFGDWIYVAYRGTDESLVGFKEDFNMCFSAPVMAQKDAVAYLRQVLNKYRDQEVYTGGHSKGGNLAVYSHVGIDGEYRKRIVKIFNNDGPGFTEEILKTPAYRETAKKVIKLLPHGSVVGILMDDEEEYSIVKAKGDNGIVQHDGFNWDIKGTKFVKKDKFTDQSIRINQTLKLWLASLDREERNKFIDEFYGLIVKSTDASILGDISGKEIQSALAIVKNINSMDEESKKILVSAIKKLLKSTSEARGKLSMKKKLQKKAGEIMKINK
nr:Mbeg1-like protein [uncultured Peptostreptococcus sp.]